MPPRWYWTLRRRIALGYISTLPHTGHTHMAHVNYNKAVNQRGLTACIVETMCITHFRMGPCGRRLHSLRHTLCREI